MNVIQSTGKAEENRHPVSANDPTEAPPQFQDFAPTTSFWYTWFMTKLKQPDPLHLPRSLEENLFKKLQTTNLSFSQPFWLSDFRTAIRRGYIPNYTHEAAAFHYLFFGANFFKSRKAYQMLIKPTMSRQFSYRILDLGCGAGASSAGVLDALLADCGYSENDIYILGLDKSKTQLSFYQDVFGTWTQDLQRRITFETSEADVMEFLRETCIKWDLIICSYLHVEETVDKKNELSKLLKKMAHDGHVQILIIDSDDDAEQGIAYSLPSGAHFQFQRMEVDFPLLHRLSLDACPKYCAVQGHERTVVVPEPLAAYFDCWVFHDIPRLRKIFTEDATYDINCEKRLRGIDQIEQYWRTNSREQRQVDYTIHKYFDDLKEQIVWWTARFIRHDRQEAYAVHGMLLVSIEGNRIKRLVEYYSKSAFPLRESEKTAAIYLGSTPPHSQN